MLGLILASIMEELVEQAWWDVEKNERLRFITCVQLISKSASVPNNQ
jgi:hypothetical protein